VLVISSDTGSRSDVLDSGRFQDGRAPAADVSPEYGAQVEAEMDEPEIEL